MFGLTTILILGTLAQSALGTVRDVPDSRTIGLKFGDTAKDHVLFQPAMEPLEESFTVCGWVRKLLSGDRRWFAYGTSADTQEIFISDNGHNHIFGVHLDMTSKVAGALGAWRHHCITWSATSKVYQAYYEGKLIGTTATASGTKLGMDGYMVFGNEFDSYGGGFKDEESFAGELFKANVFNRELSSEEINEMNSEGFCSEVEEKYGRTRYLKWSDFLLEERSGNVTEINVGCGTKRIGSRWDVLFLESFYNKVLTKELLESLRSNWNVLG